MIVPTTACEIIDTWTVGGLRGTGSHDVMVRDVFVPTDYGSGFTDPHVLPEYRYRIPPFSRVIPGLGGWRWGSREPRSRPSARLPARRCDAVDLDRVGRIESDQRPAADVRHVVLQISEARGLRMRQLDRVTGRVEPSNRVVAE
jgi:hypothetical protein